MLSIVTWKWEPLNPEFRSKFDASHVNTLRNMVARHFRAPFRFYCVTDDPDGLDPRIRVVPLRDDLRHVPSPLGPDYPTCYSRLWAFSASFMDVVGPRFISLDLDCVIVDEVTDIWTRDEDFVIWGNDTYKNWLPGQQLAEDAVVTPYNGSMWMMDCGARGEVYDEFAPETSPRITGDAGYVGSDQGWISYVLGPNEATWGKDDGVYAWRSHLRNRGYRLPSDARIIFFQGNEKPWDAAARKKANWIVEHYR